MPLVQTFALPPPPGGETTGTAQWLRPALPLAAAVLLVSMVAQFRVPLLPAIGRELVMSPTQLGLVATTFAIGRLALDLPVGRLADRVDPLRLLGYAAGTTTIGSVMLAAAPSAGWVLASSLLLGAASATANTTGMTALSGSAPAARRGSAMALYSGSLLGGQALGPAVSGAIAGLRDWRVASYAAGVLGMVVAVGAAAWHRSDAHVAIERVTSEGGGDDVAELTPAQRAVLYSVGFSVFFTLGAMPQTLVPLIGAAAYDLRVSTIGFALGLGGLSRIVGAAVTGAVSDRISRRAALLPGLALQAGGVGLLAAGGGSGWWLAAIILMSLGSSGTAVGATMLGDRTHGTRLGQTLGRYRFAGDAGLVVGPGLAAFAYDNVGTGAAVALVTGVLAVSTVAAAIVLPETHAPRRAAAAAIEQARAESGGRDD